MKLIFNVLALVNAILQFILEGKDDKVIEFWRNVRRSSNHCLRRYCRDDKQTTLIKIVLKKMNELFPKKYLSKLSFEDLLKKFPMKPIDQVKIQELVEILSKLFRIYIKNHTREF